MGANYGLYANPYALPQHSFAGPLSGTPPMGGGMMNMQTAPNSSKTLYVQGLPSDVTRRELSHIFRPWSGYQTLRLVTKDSIQFPETMHTLCFVEFENSYLASLAMHALQNYKMDEDDINSPCLSITYAKNKRQKKERW